MHTNTLTGRIYIATNWLVKLVFINIIWMLFNIPTILTIVNLFISETKGQLTFSILLILTIAILFFYPATTAMFGVIRVLIMKQPNARIIRTYWKTYKENYIRSILGGLVFVLLSIVIIFYFIFFDLQSAKVIKYLVYAILLYLFMSNMHYFSSNVHSEITFIESVKNAFLLTIKNPIVSFGCSIISVLLIMISMKIPILIILGIGSSIATLAFLAFYKRSLIGLIDNHSRT